MCFVEKRYIELFLKSSPSGRSGNFRGGPVNDFWPQVLCAH